MNAFERLRSIFRDVFLDDTIQLTRDMTAKDIEAWDSLSHINLLVAIEQEFGFRFEMREVKNLKNVGEMIDLIQKKTPSIPGE